MKRPIRMSMQTRKNWGIDFAVFVGAVIAGLTGIYFLFVTSGGYNGGRNAFYNVTILFGRETWEEFHLWGGLLMILAVALHFLIHWRWVVSMTRRVVQAIKTGQSSLSSGAKWNIGIDLLIAVSFLITALSGLYFWLLTEGGYQGGSNPDWDPNFLFSRVTWDIVHTWSGVVLILAAILHFYIHWGWVKKVTLRFFLSLLPQNQEPQGQPTQQHS